jgi:surfeit locus 1 family protein
MSLNMADSSEGSADYARSDGAQATVPREVRLPMPPLRFRPRLLPTLAALVLIPLFVAFGQWQWNKASAKEGLQTLFDARGAEPAVQLPSAPADPQMLRYRQVLVRGSYEPEYQILIDNRVHHELAGYHVLTPLRLEGSEMRVLVNRGWVPALADHSRWPQVATPVGVLEVAGMAIVPGTRYLTLAPDDAEEPAPPGKCMAESGSGSATRREVPFPLQPVVIELSPESPAGGFAREWPRPDERIERHLGYAFQWWGFAIATVIIWLVVNFRRSSPSAR